MRSQRLKTFTDRDESHQELERVLKAGTHPRAECRVEPELATEGKGGIYTVWSGPRDDEQKEP
jgi:hypothetical protein